MNTVLIIIIVLILLGAGSFPVWQHSQAWGPWPSSAIGIIIVVLLVLMLMGKL